MSDPCVLDTNILLYPANPAAPQHAPAKASVARLLAEGDRPAVAPQALFEFWSVATRPVTANGLGWTAGRTRAELDLIRRRFS